MQSDAVGIVSRALLARQLLRARQQRQSSCCLCASNLRTTRAMYCAFGSGRFSLGLHSATRRTRYGRSAFPLAAIGIAAAVVLFAAVSRAVVATLATVAASLGAAACLPSSRLPNNAVQSFARAMAVKPCKKTGSIDRNISMNRSKHLHGSNRLNQRRVRKLSGLYRLAPRGELAFSRSCSTPARALHE